MGLWKHRKKKASGTSLTIGDDRLVYVHDAVSQSLLDDELIGVEIETTDKGPLVDDMFFRLTTADGVMVIPSETPGAERLLAHLQRLPGFDSEAVIAASGSTQNQVFVCWQRT